MRTLFLIGLTALASASGAAAPKSRPAAIINERNDGDTLRVPVNAEIRAVLTARIGQGWELYGPSQIALIAPATVEGLARKPNAYDKLSQRTFRVRATAPGRYPLIFRLRNVDATAHSRPADEVTVTIDAT